MLGQTADQPAVADASAVQAQTGRTYRVELALDRAAGLTPEWLVPAVRVAYPGAELAKVEHYSATTATVLVAWKGAPAAVKAGDAVTPMVQGLQVPYEALPVGTVRSVQLVDVATGSVQKVIDDTGGERAIVLRLTLAGALLVGTWYLCRRVAKHV